jgi:hypothetical protein
MIRKYPSVRGEWATETLRIRESQKARLKKVSDDYHCTLVDAFDMVMDAFEKKAKNVPLPRTM